MRKVKYTVDKERAEKKTRALKGLGLAARYQLENWGSGTRKTIIRNISGDILKSGSGKLRRSIKHKVKGTKEKSYLEIGSWGVIYARILERGGTIRPKRVQWLTIPLPGVKGRARNFRNTFFLKSKKGNLLLMQREINKIKPLFVLKKRVDIPAFQWLETSIDERRLALRKMMSKSELLRIAGRLT